MPPAILPLIVGLFRTKVALSKEFGREGDIKRIMSGRWLPNTPTAEVAYLTYVVRGLPIPEDMAETIYDEWLQQNDEAYMKAVLEGRGGGETQSPDNRPSAPVPSQPSSDGSDLAIQRLSLRTGGGSADEPAVSLVPTIPVADPSALGEAPVSNVAEGEHDPVNQMLKDMGYNTRPFGLEEPRFKPPSPEGQPTEGQRQVDPFIRMLQVALIMRMLGATGGAFGALALAPILKDLFDEMMGRKKRDTGQTGQTNQTGQGNNPPTPRPDTNQRLEPLPAVDEVVIQLYNSGLSPAQIASVIPFIIKEVELTPEQVEQVLNNSGIHGVHIPTKPRTPTQQGQGNQKEKEQKPQGQQNQQKQPSQRGQAKQGQQKQQGQQNQQRRQQGRR